MYNSEHGQDKWLNENIFKNKRNGVFVEIGALDGIQHSNSLFFEKELAWSGLCIEANPKTFELLKKNRQCFCENVAIADHRNISKFLKCDGGLYGWSGLIEGIEYQHLKRIAEHIPEEKQSIIEVKCELLNNVLRKYFLQDIDYMGIDTEGMEYNILSSFSFDKFNVEVFDIENNFMNFPIEELMNEKGYKKIIRLDVNDIYIKKENDKQY